MKKERIRFSLLSLEERKKSIDAIIAFFLDERGESIGVIAAGDILQFFEDTLAKQIYNSAIDDARDTLKKQVEELDFNLDQLKKIS